MEDFDIQEIRQVPGIKSSFSLDFGFTDPNAFICAMVDNSKKIIYVFDEWYQTGTTNQKIAAQIKAMGYGGQVVLVNTMSLGESKKRSFNHVLSDHGLNVNLICFQRPGGTSPLIDISSLLKSSSEVISYASSTHTQHKIPLGTDMEVTFNPSSIPRNNIFWPVGL